jgi:6-pyruvoyltetrahydropterin/6-carboxytetrahydropterin synthase
VTRCLLTKSVNFEAAHHLHQGDANHPYRRLHGHSFRLDVSVEDEPEVHAILDHSFLNEIEGLETPTLENICAWVAVKLRPRLPNLKRVSVARPSLGETCTIDVS